jgi:hypothetical protein
LPVRNFSHKSTQVTNYLKNLPQTRDKQQKCMKNSLHTKWQNGWQKVETWRKKTGLWMKTVQNIGATVQSCKYLYFLSCICFSLPGPMICLLNRFFYKNITVSISFLLNTFNYSGTRGEFRISMMSVILSLYQLSVHAADFIKFFQNNKNHSFFVEGMYTCVIFVWLTRGIYCYFNYSYV